VQTGVGQPLTREFQMGNFQKYWSQNVGQDFIVLDFFVGGRSCGRKRCVREINPVNPPPFCGSLPRKSLISRMDWVSCVGDINLPHTPFPPARSPPNKKIKYNKILTQTAVVTLWQICALDLKPIGKTLSTNKLLFQLNPTKCKSPGQIFIWVKRFELSYPKVDDLVGIIKEKGPDYLIFKKDLKRVYR
jgi:hypothetical protein